MNFLNFSQDFSRLRQFYFVAKAGSLTEAAKMLNVSHAALSISMKTLEHRLKTKLLTRTAKGMKLTPDGERVYEYTTKCFIETDMFFRTFFYRNEDIQGEIKIISTPFFAEVELTHYLLPFLEEYPNLNIKVITTIDDFDVNDADIAIRSYIPYRPDLEQFLLLTHHHKLWASPDYIEKFGMPKTLKDLDNHKILSFGLDKIENFSFTNWLNWILYAGVESGQPRKSFYQVSSHGGLIRAASKGYGIVQLPKEWVDLTNSNLIEVLPDVETPKINLFFIVNKKIAKQKRILKLYEYLQQCFVIPTQ